MTKTDSMVTTYLAHQAAEDHYRATGLIPPRGEPLDASSLDDMAKKMLSDAVRVVEANGYVVVPRTPTNAMWEGFDRWHEGYDPRTIWDAMLAARPRIGEKP